MARSGNPNPKRTHKFPQSPQGLDAKKSEGQINLAKNNNILYTARTLFENADILPQMINNIKKEVEMGVNRNAIDFFKAIKENETQNIKLDGGLEVQKVFVTKEEKKEVDKHIDEIIND